MSSRPIHLTMSPPAKQKSLIAVDSKGVPNFPLDDENDDPNDPLLHDDLLSLGGSEAPADDAAETKSLLGSRRRGSSKDWMRPYWLGTGLFLILFGFWVLDSLKDPVFAILVAGDLDRHQPPAKLCSVVSTLVLVSLIEFVSHARKKQREYYRRAAARREDGGDWRAMNVRIQVMDDSLSQSNTSDRVTVTIFIYCGLSYGAIFCFFSYILRYHPAFTSTSAETFDIDVFKKQSSSASITLWHIMGYFLYASIESFGSIAVATFWSYSNSTLSLHDAERFYGLIIALAQMGAIGGSTMVTVHVWSTTVLFLFACLLILLQLIVMTTYDRRFKATAAVEQPARREEDDAEEQEEQQQLIATMTTPPSIPLDPPEKTVFSGVYMILRHNYVLMILGVSCLYEVSMTCLDYQLKLLGWNKFERQHVVTPDTIAQSASGNGMTFAKFMGRYGQLTNIVSLLCSSMVFPYLIKRYGLRHTLRVFPTLLFLSTVIAFGAAPGNLTVLFICMSLLKAMIYSIHDPAKEILYIPTHHLIKLRSKFWIDVVGARVAKAVGSSLNTMAGSVDRSLKIGSIPSVATAGALWYVCYKVGVEFDSLIQSNTIVGNEPPNRLKDIGGLNWTTYKRLSTVDEEERESSMRGLRSSLSSDSGRRRSAPQPEMEDLLQLGEEEEDDDIVEVELSPRRALEKAS